jgi:hypothetical protein
MSTVAEKQLYKQSTDTDEESFRSPAKPPQVKKDVDPKIENLKEKFNDLFPS